MKPIIMVEIIIIIPVFSTSPQFPILSIFHGMILMLMSLNNILRGMVRITKNECNNNLGVRITVAMIIPYFGVG